MILYLVIGSVLILVSSGNEVQKLPCDFFDSLNITGGSLHPNGSMEFEEVFYSKDQYALIDYDLRNGSTQVAIQPYYRGCLCKIKNCIRLCCPYGSYWYYNIQPGRHCRWNDLSKNTTVEIVDQNNQLKNVDLAKEFGFVSDQSCNMYQIPTKFNITHTGQVIIDDKLWSHREYCLNFEPNEKTNDTLLKVWICRASVRGLNNRYVYLAYGMLASVLFIIATSLVYICIPELRNLHGKCLLFYLFHLMIGYILVTYMILKTHKISKMICYAFGYTKYFSHLSAFLWVNVISFDIWWNFRSTCKPHSIFSENKRLFFYVVYAFGVASLLTLVVYVIDSSESIPAHLQPGIKSSNVCFLKNERLSQFLYFYLPLLIICIMNITFFVLTALKIRRTQLDLKKVTSMEESSRHQSNLNTDKDDFLMFTRLFCVMGVTWLMEAASGVIDPENKNPFFFFFDSLNALQGVIIFVLSVVKRRVLCLVKKKVRDYTPVYHLFSCCTIKSRKCDNATKNSTVEKFRNGAKYKHKL